MKILGITKPQLEKAARSTGVALIRDTYQIDKNGRSWRTRIIPTSETFRKIGSNGRRIHAVCYHGHYCFMRTLFYINPDVKIRSVHGSYDSIMDLRANTLAEKNIGSIMFPITWDESCLCSEEDKRKAIYA